MIILSTAWSDLEVIIDSYKIHDDLFPLNVSFATLSKSQMKDYLIVAVLVGHTTYQDLKNLALLNTVGDLYVKRHHPQSRYLDFLPVCFTFDC